MEECIICFEENPRFVILQCNHKLCETCFILVQENTNACPLCNGELIIKHHYYYPCSIIMCVLLLFGLFIVYIS